MYLEHWKLNARPFENCKEDLFYYPSESHQAALLKLRYAIENRRAVAALCGPVGIGKSLLLKRLGDQLADEFSPFCSVVYPKMDAEQLMRHIVHKLDPASLEGFREPSADLECFEAFLRKNVSAGRQAIIVIDEAHLLEDNQLLEPLRLMLNIAADAVAGESAWTLILAGQANLLSQVERHRALDERVAVKCVLNRMLLEESAAYIQHRIHAAGGDSDTIFSESAIQRLHSLTQGIPRRINRLCDLALMVGYAEESSTITEDMIEGVHEELAAPSIR